MFSQLCGLKSEPSHLPILGPLGWISGGETQEGLKKKWERKRNLHIFSSVSTSCCRRSIFSRLCQEKGGQLNADRSALMSGNILEKVAKKIRGQQVKMTYLSLHAFLPSFCSSRGRGISRVLGTRREVTGWEEQGVARDTHPENNQHLRHSPPPPNTQANMGQFPGQWRWGSGPMLSTNRCWSVTREVQKSEEFRKFYSNRIK